MKTLDKAIKQYRQFGNFQKFRTILESDYYKVEEDVYTSAVVYLCEQKLKKSLIMHNLDVLPLTVVMSSIHGRKFDFPFISQVLSFYVIEKSDDEIESLTRFLAVLYNEKFFEMLTRAPLKLQYPYPVMVPFNGAIPGLQAVHAGLSIAAPFVELRYVLQYWFILFDTDDVELAVGDTMDDKKFAKERNRAKERLAEYASSMIAGIKSDYWNRKQRPELLDV